MAAGSHFVKMFHWPTTTLYKFTFGQYIQTSMLGTREYTLRSPFRANAHNSSFVLYLLNN